MKRLVLLFITMLATLGASADIILGAFGIAAGAIGVPMGSEGEALPIRLFGTEEAVYGFDRGSIGCKVKNVYGVQFGTFGGGVEEDMCGLQLGLLWIGWVMRNELEHSRMYGLEFAPIATRTATAKGVQLSGVYAVADEVDGFQFSAFGARSESVYGVQLAGFYTDSVDLRGWSLSCICKSDEVKGVQVGVVNVARSMHGVQLGVYNQADEGGCLQLGLINRFTGNALGFFPVVNIGF